MTTPILKLPEIASDQLSKDVTHNEALEQLEGMLIRVLSMTVTAQPGAPAEGDTYLIPAGATGTDWATYSAGDIAHYYGGAWYNYAPTEGLCITNLADGLRYQRTATAWALLVTAPRFVTEGKNADFTVTDADRGKIFLIDTSLGPVTATLSPATDNGFVVGFIKETSDANAVTIAADAAAPDSIAGAASLDLAKQWDGTLIDADGIDLWVPIGGGSGGTSLPILDGQALLANATDQTKQAILDLSLLTTGNTRTLSLPDKDGMVATVSDITGGGLASAEFDEDPATTTGLTFGYLAGSMRNGATIYDLAANTVALAASATNYVELDPATQAISVNQVGFTAGRIPLRELVTDATTITTDTDRRVWIIGGDVNYGDGLTEALNCNDQIVQAPELKDYAETGTAPASSAGALGLDLSTGNNFDVTLTEDTTISITNPPAAGKFGSLSLVLTQDATGGWAVTWPASVKWAGGAAPALSTAAGAIDVLTFITKDAGASWYGFPAGLAMA